MFALKLNIARGKGTKAQQIFQATKTFQHGRKKHPK